MRQKKRRLTSEQDEPRLSGLRMPARTISCAHLGLPAEEEALRSEAPGVHAHSNHRPLMKNGGHVW